MSIFNRTIGQIAAAVGHTTPQQQYAYVVMIARYYEINQMCKDLDKLPDMPAYTEDETSFFASNSKETMGFDLSTDHTSTFGVSL